MNTYHIDDCGGFTCADPETCHTSYAYPSSDHATAAKRNPHKVAAEMLRQANYINPLLPADIVKRANDRNWRTLQDATTWCVGNPINNTDSQSLSPTQNQEI